MSVVMMVFRLIFQECDRNVPCVNEGTVGGVGDCLKKTKLSSRHTVTVDFFLKNCFNLVIIRYVVVRTWLVTVADLGGVSGVPWNPPLRTPSYSK